MKKKESETEGWMMLCAVTGITSLLFALIIFYFQHWVMGSILLLITIRQAIVFPKWRKKLKQEEEQENESE